MRVFDATGKDARKYTLPRKSKNTNFTIRECRSELFAERLFVLYINVKAFACAAGSRRRRSGVRALLPCDFFGMALAYRYVYLVFDSGAGCLIKEAGSLDRAHDVFPALDGLATRNRKIQNRYGCVG